MTGPSKDPSVFDEPHLRGKHPKLDPSEARAARALERSRRRADAEADRREHGVWDEPALSVELAGPAPEGAGYGAWLEERRRATGRAKSWAVTLAVGLLAGPWAVLGAFWGSGQTVFSLLAIVVFGPVVEETMKIAGAAYVVEKRPYLVRSGVQVPLAAFAGGCAFAAIENMLYLGVYIEEPSPGIVLWRWTVCVALHAGCSLLASVGLLKVRRDAHARGARPRLSLGGGYLAAAIVIHGAYNAFAVLLGLFHLRA